MSSRISFFLGANSKEKFVTYFKELQRQDSAMQLFIFKGGPGCGKSSLMKKILALAESKGHKVEAIYCASDPSSLDAVIDHTAKFSIMDGTSPHTEDPILPGARQHIISMGDFWDTKKLSDRSVEIEKTTQLVSDCHRGAVAYISGAAELLSENLRIGERYLLKKEAVSFAKSIIKELSGGDNASVSVRLLSASSVGKIKVFSHTPFLFADKVYVIEDDIGAFSDFILKSVLSAANLMGERTLFCPCSVIPGKCDHLIFPDSRVAIVTQNRFLHFDGAAVIKGKDFYSPFPLPEDIIRRQDISGELLSEGCQLIKKAKDIHDTLEAFYIDAMDFSGADSIFTDIVKRFYS